MRLGDPGGVLVGRGAFRDTKAGACGLVFDESIHGDGGAAEYGEVDGCQMESDVMQWAGRKLLHAVNKEQ